MHRRRELPTEIAEAVLPAGDPVYLPGLLVAALGISSNSEARRLIEGGGVRLEGEPIAGLELPRPSSQAASCRSADGVSSASCRGKTVPA